MLSFGIAQHGPGSWGSGLKGNIQVNCILVVIEHTSGKWPDKSSKHVCLTIGLCTALHHQQQKSDFNTMTGPESIRGRGFWSSSHWLPAETPPPQVISQHRTSLFVSWFQLAPQRFLLLNSCLVTTSLQLGLPFPGGCWEAMTASERAGDDRYPYTQEGTTQGWVLVIWRNDNDHFIEKPVTVVICFSVHISSD